MSPLSTRSGSSAAGNSRAPLRLGEGGGTEFERQLVSSASRDGVPAASMAKVAAGLRAAIAAREAAAAAGASLPGARAAGSFGVLRNLRPWAMGAVGAAIVGAGVVAMLSREATWSAAPAETVPPLVELPKEPSAWPNAEVTRPSVEMPSMPVAAPPADRPRRPAPRASVKASGDRARARVAPTAAAVDRGPGLAAEVRAIESIQTLLGWGQVQQAAEAVAHYRRQFPNGELALEADLLDVDVALAAGDRAKAKQLARALLARPAAARYRTRLEAIEAHSQPRAAGSIDEPAYMNERR
jgi:hypothetical protein